MALGAFRSEPHKPANKQSCQTPAAYMRPHLNILHDVLRSVDEEAGSHAVPSACQPEQHKDIRNATLTPQPTVQ